MAKLWVTVEEIYEETKEEGIQHRQEYLHWREIHRRKDAAVYVSLLCVCFERFFGVSLYYFEYSAHVY